FEFCTDLCVPTKVLDDFNQIKAQYSKYKDQSPKTKDQSPKTKVQSSHRFFMPGTLFEKLWDAHVVRQPEDQPTLLYIDLHLVHEVTSPQAFEGLRVANRRVRR